MYKYIRTIIILLIALGLGSCKKERYFNNDSSLKLDFSTDTVTFDTVFTSIGSSTRKLMIYNNNNDNLKINSIRLSGGSDSQFSINVDGQAGDAFSDKEIYAKDSLYVFIKVTINPNSQNTPFFVEDKLIFNTNNNEQIVYLTAYGQNAVYIVADRKIKNFPKFKIVADSLQETHWTKEKPYVVYGYALINSYGTLVIEEGTHVYFHNNSGLWSWSEGQLRVEGTANNPVIFQGDRLESFYTDEPGQWDRIWLMEARPSYGHSIDHAIVRNGFIGIQAERFIKDNDEPLVIKNAIIENHTGMGIYANQYRIDAANFVIANCGNYAMALTGGGRYTFKHGTIVNYWTNSTRTTPSLLFNNVYFNPIDNIYYGYDFNFEMDNSIIYGSLSEEFETNFPVGTDTTYMFNNCLLKTKRKNNPVFSNYNDCLFNSDPKILDYNDFNYHLDTLSPAIGIGNPIYSTGWLQYDLDGVSREDTPDAGAYQYVPNAE